MTTVQRMREMADALRSGVMIFTYADLEGVLVQAASEIQALKMEFPATAARIDAAETYAPPPSVHEIALRILPAALRVNGYDAARAAEWARDKAEIIAEEWKL